MANKPKSVYLTDRTMSALRGDDALSGRLNQIVDRYLQITEGCKNWVLDLTTPEDLAIMRAALVHVAPKPGMRLHEIRVALVTQLKIEPALAAMVDDLDKDEVAALLDLLETIPTATPATHS